MPQWADRRSRRPQVLPCPIPSFLRPAAGARRPLLAALALPALLAAVGGCDRQDPEAAGTLTVAVESGPGPIDPRRGGDQATSRVGQLLFDGLVRIDSSGRVVPALAESWEIPDPRTYVFHLREGVRFHDGSPCDAEDVRWTLESVLSPEFAGWRREDFREVERVEAPDGRTVILRLRRPFAPLLFNLAMGIVPAGSGEDFHRQPLGTGPYRLVRHLRDREVLFRRQPGHFGGDGRMEWIRFKVVPDAGIRLLELRRGGVDLVINDLGPDMVAGLRDDPAFRVLETPGCTYAYLGFNLQDPLLADRRVRLAIALAIDRETMIREWLRGTADPATGLVPPMSWAYAGDVFVPPYDPDRARRILDEAGHPDPDGPEGPRGRFTLELKGSTQEISRQKGAILQQYLGRVGIDLRLRLLEWGTFYEDVKRGSFQLFTLNWTGLGLLDPDILRTRFHSLLVPPAGLNRGRYANPRLDRLLEEGLLYPERQRRFPIYAEAQRILAEDLPYVSLWYARNVAVLRRGLEGLEPSPTGDFRPLKDVRREPAR